MAQKEYIFLALNIELLLATPSLIPRAFLLFKRK
jgi:hypothetical protein